MRAGQELYWPLQADGLMCAITGEPHQRGHKTLNDQLPSIARLLGRVVTGLGPPGSSKETLQRYRALQKLCKL